MANKELDIDILDIDNSMNPNTVGNNNSMSPNSNTNQTTVRDLHSGSDGGVNHSNLAREKHIEQQNQQQAAEDAAALALEQQKTKPQGDLLDEKSNIVPILLATQKTKPNKLKIMLVVLALILILLAIMYLIFYKKQKNKKN